MTRQYSPRSFLRQAPNLLLKGFFDQRRVLSEIPWMTLRETEIKPIFDAWQALPASERSAIDRAFHVIHEMACEAGIHALIEEGTFHGLNLAAVLERHESFYEKAMWAYLKQPSVFGVASLFISADGLLGRHWVRQKSIPKEKTNTSAQAASKLADELSEFYRTEQDGGHRCTVETYLRGGRQHYYFAYPDDYTDTSIGHDLTE